MDLITEYPLNVAYYRSPARNILIVEHSPKSTEELWLDLPLVFGQMARYVGRDGRVALWDSERLSPTCELAVGVGKIDALDWSPDGAEIVAGNDDGAVFGWSL